MISHHRLFWIFLVAVGISAAVATVPAYNSPFCTQRQNAQGVRGNKSEDPADALPTVDFYAGQSPDPEINNRRQKAGKKYNRRSTAIAESIYPVSRMVHFEESDPTVALPIETASVIVIAEVTKAEAVLSSDKSGVYSEFTLKIDEVFKDTSAAPLKSGDTTVVEREGGKVRFPSGHILQVLISQTSMPETKQKYLLFLLRDPRDQSLCIYTGYLLSGETVAALDYYSAVQGYNGATVEDLLRALKSRLKDE